MQKKIRYNDTNLDPSVVLGDGVAGEGEELNASLGELLLVNGHPTQLRRAHRSEVQRVREQDAPPAQQARLQSAGVTNSSDSHLLPPIRSDRKREEALGRRGRSLDLGGGNPPSLAR